MKTDNDNPTLKKGWLMAGKRVEYDNTPMIQTSKVKAICFYEVLFTGFDNEKTPTGTWDIKFDDEKWHYKTYDLMIEDYHTIVSLLRGTDTNEVTEKDKKYI